ncbi:MAG: hypothetical protein CM1200mP2_33330 [Planctomycetaceae bacterium]|nr:MAG: hypothetical protein CM1200mP2_33330 [Planctomycetaceae bacterium]
MSYRTIKRLLGETNFELKSLVLFGLGLTVLATIPFALYWWQTSGLVSEGNRQAARQMIPAIILAHHWKWDQDEEMKPFGETIEEMVQDTLPKQLSDFRFELFSPDPSTAGSPTDRPIDPKGYEMAREFNRMFKEAPDQPLEIVREVERESSEQSEYQFYSGIVAEKSCIECHRSLSKVADLQVGDLIGVVKISMPLEQARASIHRVFAFVISAEFVKVVLAILAIYVIVRYVITKPVMHLKKGQRRHRPGQSRHAGRDPYRGRVRGTQPCVQPDAPPPGNDPGRTQGRQQRPGQQDRPVGPGQPATLRAEQPQERVPGPR